jgi:hypothetical protein
MNACQWDDGPPRFEFQIQPTNEPNPTLHHTQHSMGQPENDDEAASTAAAPSPSPPALLLRLRLPGTEAMALVGVCRTRVLKHQQERQERQERQQKDEKGEEGDDELAEAAREVSARSRRLKSTSESNRLIDLSNPQIHPTPTPITQSSAGPLRGRAGGSVGRAAPGRARRAAVAGEPCGGAAGRRGGV